MAKKSSSKGMDTGTKVVIGLAAVALILFFANGSPDNDSWEADADDKAAPADSDAVDLDLDEDSSGDEVTVPADDPWTSGSSAGPSDDDDESEPPVDDPWTRGSSAGSSDDDDDDPDLPADDPWTRGSDADGGFGDDGPAPCVGVSDFQTHDGSVQLPIDRSDDAFASPDCTIVGGQSGGAVWLVQAALVSCNGQQVPIDGVSSPALAQAIAAVQSGNGLAADGVYGPATREAMAWPTVVDGGGGRSQCLAHPDVS